MPDRAAPKPNSTRRGVILGAAALTLVLAALVTFAVLDGSSKGPIEAKFVRFDRATNGYATRAVLRLANKSGKIVGSFRIDSVGVVSCRFFFDNSTNAGWENPRVVGGGEIDLRPHSQVEAAATLPEDGRTGRVAVVLTLQRPKPSAWLTHIRTHLRLKQPPLTEVQFVICDQVIQSPIVLHDGTVQPPRLLSAEEVSRNKAAFGLK